MFTHILDIDTKNTQKTQKNTQKIHKNTQKKLFFMNKLEIRGKSEEKSASRLIFAKIKRLRTPYEENMRGSHQFPLHTGEEMVCEKIKRNLQAE
jgi:hypothetical protein